MLQSIFVLLFILAICYILILHVFNTTKTIEYMTDKSNDSALVMTNKNAGQIQQLKDEIDEIKDTFNNLKPLEKDVNINAKVLANLRDNAAVRKAQESVK